MIKKLLGWVTAGLLAVVLVIVGCAMVLVKQGWQFDAVLSGSMVPVFQVGGMAIFKPATANDVKVGDIITFQYPDMNTPICHRVISMENTADGLLIHTKGDANNTPDEKSVTAAMVKGINVAYLPKGGYLIDASNFGKQQVQLGSRSFPAAVLLVAVMGLAFIGLTLRETFEFILFPGRVRQKEILKRRAALLARRRKLYGPA